nr:hypothetical protein [Tanacetum cinerariifolium]
MVAILEKDEYNTDFHPMVDFIATSPLRIETTEEGTHILATVDGIQRTVSESSLRHNLKLRDEDGIVSLPDTELFENLTLMGDVSKGEACPTDSGFIADQDRATIAKSSSLSHDSAPRVTSPIAAEGREAATERISDDSEELARVLTSIDAATVLAGGIDIPTGSGFIPTAGLPVGAIPTGSDDILTTSPVFATATVVTPYSRRKGKEVMVESDTPKKQRLQEQIDAQFARELEEQQEREDKKMTEQIARYAEVARIHAEEELQCNTPKNA